MDIETESMKPTFYPDGDRGFFGIIPGKDKNFGYALIKLDNDLRLKWRKPYFARKTVQQVIDAQSDENKLIILKSDAAGGSRKKMDVEVVAYSSKSGSELWTYKVNKEDRLSYPTEMALNHKGELAIAGMFFYGDKFKKKNSDGIFFKLISPEGKIIGESDQDWDGELQKYMRESNDGPVSLAKPKVVFEDILFDAKNGEVKVVGELFVDAAALTSVTLSGAGASGRASAAFSMRNLLFFTFSSDGSLVDFYDVEKATQKVSAGTPQKGVLGVQIAKQRGLLPYQFTTVSETGELICIYVDYVTEQNGEMVTAAKAAFSASALGILNLNQSSSKKVVKTYLPFSKKAAGMADSGIDVEAKGMKTYVSGGLPGKLLLSFYLEKEKTLKLFLVDIN